MNQITNHKIYFGNSQKMRFIKDKSVDLIVTSPIYPMIAMWDEVFGIPEPTDFFPQPTLLK